MKPHRKLAAIAVAALAVLGVAGCSSSGSKDTAADSLTVAWVVDPSWAQVPVANDLGYFKQHGVNVKIVPFPTGAAALEALAGGAVDVANGGDVPTSAAARRIRTCACSPTGRSGRRAGSWRVGPRASTRSRT